MLGDDWWTAIVRRERSPDAKRPTNLSVRPDLVDAAREFGINLSALLERALTHELDELKRREWRSENAGAFGAYNENLKRYGTFSSHRRTF
jgi:antitoxin CcdA